MKFLRPAGASDAPGILAIYRPWVLDTAVSFELSPPSEKEMVVRILDADFPWLVSAHDSEVTGYAYAGKHRSRGAYQWAAEVSAYVGEGHRGKGIATCLYGALLEILAHQGYVTALAGIALPNESSIGFHEARGFERAAMYRSVGHKLGVWRDVGWWQLDIGERALEPKPPRSWSEVRHSEETSTILDGWRQALENNPATENRKPQHL